MAITRDLQFGDRGPDVMELQKALDTWKDNNGRLGKIVPDGIYGQQTVEAMMEFQRALYATGRAKKEEAVYLQALNEKWAQSHGNDDSNNPTSYKTGPIIWKGDYLNNKSSRRGVKIDTLVFHFTTSVNMDATINWFKNSKAQASSHYIIDYDGQIVKMVNDEDNAWHAGGTTTPDGQQYTNSRSIGVEIENWGKLRREGGKILHPVADIEYNQEVFGAPFHDDKGNIWMPFTTEQTKACVALGIALEKKHGPFKYIVSHEEIALLPDGRRFKTDTGPAFPLDFVRKEIGKYR